MAPVSTRQTAHLTGDKYRKDQLRRRSSGGGAAALPQPHDKDKRWRFFMVGFELGEAGQTLTNQPPGLLSYLRQERAKRGSLGDRVDLFRTLTTFLEAATTTAAAS